MQYRQIVLAPAFMEREPANMANHREPADEIDGAHWDAVEEVSELLHEQRYHEALEALRDILRADAKNPYAYFFLGVALFEVGELGPAKDAYEACLRIASRHLGARVALCHVLRALGDLRSALKVGMEALSQSPGDGDSLYAVGLVYLARGDNSAARKYLTAFLDTNPEFEVAHEVRGVLEALDGEGGPGSPPIDSLN